MATRVSYAIRHLLARLRQLNVVLDAAANKRSKLSEVMIAAGAKPDVITRGHVNGVLGYVHKLHEHLGLSVGTPPTLDDDDDWELDIREAARKDGIVLPLDALVAAFDLGEFEQEALVLAAAPAVDPLYGVAFAFIHDDRAAHAPSLDLIASLTAPDLATLAQRRLQLGPYGRLRRLGLLRTRERGHSHLQHELVPTERAIQFLFDGIGDAAAMFHDPDDITLSADRPAPLGIDLERVMKTATALAHGEIDTVGVFGARTALRGEIVEYIAARTGRGLRRLSAGDPREAFEVAAALGAFVWIDVDCLEDVALGTCGPLVGALGIGRVPVIITGAMPWRPQRVFETRAYVELRVADASVSTRRKLWQQELPELSAEHATELASRYRFAATEIRAAANVARATARTLAIGKPPNDTIEEACAAIARPTSLRYGRLIEPRTEAPELILPELETQQVHDVVRLHRLGPKVFDEWQFSTRMTSAGGVKALFAGEPGTGKTLAAELIARELGLPLFKVDLARVVSKWVGETEKNLDAAFREAEDSHAVLFFDEAEALFGARGDVRSGADRYANLEVSFLLQRLDAFGGVAILATNLRDKIDAAFTRRFHVVVAFPRPGEVDRRRLWKQAFPVAHDGSTRVAPEVDFERLSQIELTGAAIFASAQAAAFFAAESGAESIGMHHLQRGLERQFQREARVFTAEDLGDLRGEAHGG
jgi:hypothetical protein